VLTLNLHKIVPLNQERKKVFHINKYKRDPLRRVVWAKYLVRKGQVEGGT
jgi:hypothetical protein